MSMLKAMLMKKKGGGVKTLQLESVGGATYDDDFIFTNNQGGSWTNPPKYFKTKELIDIRNQEKNSEFKIKFKATSSQSGIFCADDTQTNWHYFASGYVSSSNQLWISLNANYQNAPTLQLNTWYWIKITHIKNSNNWVIEYSTDGINYNTIYTFSYSLSLPSMYMWLGAGASTGSKYTFSGSIDLKETDIIIDGKSVLWK